MKFNLKSLLADKFVRGTFILTAGTFLASAFNYLVHPLLSRYLSIGAYGDFQALLSFMAILGIFTAVVRTALTRETALLADSPEELAYLRRRTSRRLSLLGLALLALVWIFSRPLGDLLNVTLFESLPIVTLCFIYVFPLTVNRAVLAGLQAFPPLAWLGLYESSFRLVLVVVFVVLFSGGLIGAAWALTGTSLLAFAFSFYYVRRAFASASRDKEKEPANVKRLARQVWAPYALLVLWFTCLSQFFYNFDMLFVKASFSPEEAGLYGSLLTVGRIIYFVGGAIPTVMFPVLAGLKDDQTQRRFRVLLKSLGLMALLTIPAGLAIAFWPEFMVKIVVGGKYLSAAPHLPLFALAILCLTLMSVLAQYFLALARRRGFLVMTIGAIAEVLVLVFIPLDFRRVIISLVLVFGSVDLALILMLVREYRRAGGKQETELVAKMETEREMGINL